MSVYIFHVLMLGLPAEILRLIRLILPVASSSTVSHKKKNEEKRKQPKETKRKRKTTREAQRNASPNNECLSKFTLDTIRLALPLQVPFACLVEVSSLPRVCSSYFCGCPLMPYYFSAFSPGFSGWFFQVFPLGTLSFERERES